MTAIEALPLPGDATPRRNGQPVEAGGLVRAVCTDASGARVTSELVAEDVRRLGCGCWEVWTTRPGESRPHSMYVIFPAPRCGHEDGGRGSALTRQPQVIRFGGLR